MKLPGRKQVFLTMPIEALLMVVTGRATVKLPKEIPADVTISYSYVDPENQVIRLVLSHPTFDEKDPGGYTPTYKAELEEVKLENPEAPKGYSGDSLLGSEDWDKFV